MSDSISRAAVLKSELDWLGRVIDARVCLHCGQACAVKDVSEIAPPELKAADSPYSQLMLQEECIPEERLLVALALAPHIRPQALDVFLTKNSFIDRPFTEFGGVQQGSGGFWPTAETALFVLAGTDLSRRFALYPLFDNDHPFFRRGLLSLEGQPGLREFPWGRLLMAPQFIDAFTVGRIRCPPFGQSFPAKPMPCRYKWSDLVLDPQVLAQIEEIKAWIACGETLLGDWGLERRLGRGYRCLFYGPPGTGKTMTAALLGEQAQREVFRIDLSMVVSKYIGETEKNLENVFRHAEQLDCILFFDEADALFGKRTNISNAHDRYANQEVAYLLQRIEDFDGVAILASNLKQNMDEAFLRRFQSIVHFPMPRATERLRLWQNAFSPKSRLAPGVSLDELSDRYELAGGGILNVIRYCSLMALQRKSPEISVADLKEGIRREYQKEGRVL